jgi:formyl-CoA transferase
MARRKPATKKVAKAKSKAKSARAKSVRTKAMAKPATKKVVKLVKKSANGNGLPRPSSKAWGQAGRALDGVKILDFTHVQSGPTCTQLLAYLGADVIKVERPGVGDITRGQLRDVKGADSLYFTMLNGSKRSITIDSKHAKGKEILDRLVRHCDVLVENFAPGALDRMGLTWEHIHKLNPRMIVASVKGFGPGPYEDCKVYENVAQCAGGAASTTGFREGPPLVTGAQIGDSGTGLHLALGIVSALYQRVRTGRGQRVLAAMQDGVLNLCRVKLRDQQRLKHGPLTEYRQHGEGVPFGAAVPRAGNDSGGGQPGWIIKCKGWEEDPDAYIYFITQAPVWGAICDVIGKPEWKTDPDYATPPARLPRLRQIFDTVEKWTETKDKFEAMDILNKYDIPCGPILSMKEIAEEQSLRTTGTVVEVDHPTRGKYLTVGNPVKLSDSPADVRRSPLLGEHTEEILRKVLGYSEKDLAEIKSSGAITAPDKPAKAAAA